MQVDYLKDCWQGYGREGREGRQLIMCVREKVTTLGTLGAILPRGLEGQWENALEFPTLTFKEAKIYLSSNSQATWADGCSQRINLPISPASPTLGLRASRELQVLATGCIPHMSPGEVPGDVGRAQQCPLQPTCPDCTWALVHDYTSLALSNRNWRRSIPIWGPWSPVSSRDELQNLNLRLVLVPTQLQPLGSRIKSIPHTFA